MRKTSDPAKVSTEAKAPAEKVRRTSCANVRGSNARPSKTAASPHNMIQLGQSLRS